MPDFERVLDRMAVDFADTPESKARAEGFVAGKNFARKEIMITVVVLGVVIAMGCLIA